MNRHSSTVLALAVGLMLLVGTAAFALPAYRADRISTQGTITSVTRVGDQYQVSRGGIITGDTVTTDYVAFSGTPAYARDPSYQGVPYGQSGWLSATVIRPHKH